MGVTRVLNTTAQLLASEERSSRLMAFWDLVDLYDGLVGQNIPRLFGQRFWNEQVMPACATLPSNLGDLFTRYGNELYQEWVDQCIQGITTPSRVFSKTVQLADSAQPILHPHYFARHIRARRNSLHGYNLRTGDNLALLAIHDGSLPQRLPEWGRIMLMAPLADPMIFLAKFRASRIRSGRPLRATAPDWRREGVPAGREQSRHLPMVASTPCHAKPWLRHRAQERGRPAPRSDWGRHRARPGHG